MEEGYLPNLNEELNAVTQLPAAQRQGESLWLGSLMVAEVAIRSSRWFHSANN